MLVADGKSLTRRGSKERGSSLVAILRCFSEDELGLAGEFS